MEKQAQFKNILRSFDNILDLYECNHAIKIKTKPIEYQTDNINCLLLYVKTKQMGP